MEFFNSNMIKGLLQEFKTLMMNLWILELWFYYCVLLRRVNCCFCKRNSALFTLSSGPPEKIICLLLVHHEIEPIDHRITEWKKKPAVCCDAKTLLFSTIWLNARKIHKWSQVSALHSHVKDELFNIFSNQQ